MIPTSPRQAYMALRALIDDVRTLVSGAASTAAQTQSVFIFRPGAAAPQPANVFTTWPALMTAMGNVQGPKTLAVDASHVGGTATVPAGGPYNLDQVQIQAYTWGVDVLEFVTGATVTANGWRWDKGIGILTSSTAAVWNVVAPAGIIEIDHSSALQFIPVAGAVPFIHVPNGAQVSIELNHNVTFGDGTNPMVSTAGSGNAQVELTTGATLEPGALTGSTFAVIYPNSATVENDITVLERTYLNGPQLNVQESGALGPGATVTFTASASTISRASSGKVRVCGMLTAAASAGTAPGAAVSFQLFRNPGGVLIGPAVSVGVDAALNVHGTVEYFDTLPDAAAHSYGISATIGAGTLTVAAAGATMAASEEA